MAPRKENNRAPAEQLNDLKAAFDSVLRDILKTPADADKLAQTADKMRTLLDTRVLFSNGQSHAIDLNERAEGGITPLYQIVAAGLNGLIPLFIEKGADVNLADSFADTPLHHAAHGWNANARTISLLIDNGGNIDAVNIQGETPLHEAVKHGRDEQAKALINGGASLGAQTRWQNTPLHMASLCGSASCVDVLIRAGADIAARNDIGHTPFTLSRNVETTRLFLDAGADVNTVNDRGESLLHWACMNDEIKPEMIRFLIARGANIDAASATGETPLHWAIKHRPEQAAPILIEAGADVRKQDGDGKAALELARYSNTPGLQALVQSALDGEIARRIESKKLETLHARLEKLDALTGRKTKKP